MKILDVDVRVEELVQVIDHLQREHDLEETDDGVIPTVGFLRELSRCISHKRQLSSTECWQIWRLVDAYVASLGIMHQQDAELAFWYGFDVFQLTEEQRIGLYANLPRVKAQQRLQLGKLDPEDWEGVYDLVLLATGSDRLAVKARGDAVERAAKRGKTS